MYTPNLFLSVYIALSAVLTAAPVRCESRRCLSMPYNQCAAFFNGVEEDTTREVTGSIVASPPPWNATFPNARGQTMREAQSEFNDFWRLLSLDNYCSYLLHSLLCIHYFPPCVPSQAVVPSQPVAPPQQQQLILPPQLVLPPQLYLVLPCRAVCEEARRECRGFIKLNITLPEHLNCANFPLANANTPVACPDPAVHLDFSMPLGKKTVSESAQYQEVCIRIANTGESGALVSAVQVDITFVDESATGGGVDYEVSPVQTLVFPVGSVRGDQRCVNVTIIDDDLKEEEEIFTIWVSVVSPVVGVRFGGAVNSTTGHISVRITDNDECIMPHRYCGSQCQQRTSAGKKTFANNDYTYAAHIELLGVEHSRGCTALNARIIQCWELESNVCPPLNTSLTIPTCEHCPDPTAPSVGQEYLVAGIHRKVAGKRRMVLPGSGRQLGLFGVWSDRYPNFIPTEWQADNESTSNSSRG